MTPPKHHNNFLGTDPKDMKIWDFPEEEFKTGVLRKPSELQENTKDNSIKVGKEYVNEISLTEIKIIKSQTEILELKNEMKSVIMSINNTIHQAEEIIC